MARIKKERITKQEEIINSFSKAKRTVFGVAFVCSAFGLLIFKFFLFSELRRYFYNMDKDKVLEYINYGPFVTVDFFLGFAACAVASAVVVSLIFTRTKEKKSLMLAVVLVLIYIPIFFLKLPYYKYIKAEGIYIRHSFSGNENFYSWDKVSEVKVYTPGSTHIRYIFSLVDGNDFNVSYKVMNTNRARKIILIRDLINKNSLKLVVDSSSREEYEKRIKEAEGK